MKFWTIQHKDVIKMIQEEGIYQPDFHHSGYLNKVENLKVLYDEILQAFNQINGVNLPGVIFSFAQSDNNRIYPIETIEAFVEFIKMKQPVIGGYWKNIDKTNSVLIELDYDGGFNPIFIDLNDFQFLMPPIMLLPPYTEESVYRILRDIQNGRITPSEFPSGVIQAHLPNIKAENVVNVYSLSDS